jgi:hypothetical protein
MLDTVKIERVNGLDLKPRRGRRAIEKDASQAKAAFEVTTRWAGQTRTESLVEGLRSAASAYWTHKIVADEPFELLDGDNALIRELLMAAFNACITVGYVAGASLKRITLDHSKPHSRRSICADLGSATAFRRATRRSVRSRIKGNGSPEQFEEIHQTVRKTSPTTSTSAGHQPRPDLLSAGRINHKLVACMPC